MKNLVIKGHAIRGEEVIGILKMLGGKTSRILTGELICHAYYINSNGFIDYKHRSEFNNDIVYSLEEFLEKYPYKVGDKVLLSGLVKIIKQARWDSTNNEVIYKLETNVRGFSEEYYVHHYDLRPYKEEIMEETIVDTIKESKDRYRLSINYQYEIEVDEGEYYVVRRKPQYPKTYEECCKVLNIPSNGNIAYVGDWVYGGEYLEKHLDRLRKFQQLLICRDAYWKIAGEQMGLGKPWEPLDDEYSHIKYVIQTIENEITCIDTWCKTKNILELPTVEIRDAFYENFKELIELCKELL